MSGNDIQIIGMAQLNNPKELKYDSKKLPQWIAGLTASFSSVVTGTVIGWTSPAGLDGVIFQDEFRISITREEFTWISSIINIGAAISCVISGILSDLIGRKLTLLILAIFSVIGWIILIFCKSVIMLYIGRFILGFSGGALGPSASLYISEITEPKIRGTIGSYPELFIVAGVLLANILGIFTSMYIFSLISAAIPFIFFVIFYFMPESPTYHVQKNDAESARKSLKWLRGRDYDVEPELGGITESLELLKSQKISFFMSLRSKATVKAFIVSFGLMFFHQMTGLIVIEFYSREIFEVSNTNLNENTCAVIICGLEVISVFFNSLVVDRWGRRMILIPCSIAMCLATFSLGTFFYFKNHNYNTDNINWLPLLGIMIYLVTIEISFGPLSGLISSEIFPAKIRGTANSCAASLTWICVFIVIKYFNYFIINYGLGYTFWGFSVICGISIIFVIFLVPETKNKSLEQIQIELGGNMLVNEKNMQTYL